MSKKTVLILVIAGLFLLCACVAATVGIWYIASRTPSPIPTPTLSPTMQVTPVVTTKPSSTPSISLPIKSTFTEQFNNNSNGWPTGNYNGTYSSGIESITNGVYVMNITAKDGMYHASYSDESVDYENFEASIDASIQSGPNDAAIGLMVKNSDDARYGFVVAPGLGKYDFYYEEDGDVDELVSWQESAAIVNGLNHLKISCLNGRFNLYINGVLVDSVTDRRVTTGEIGLLVELYDEDDHGLFEFDDLIINKY